MTRLERILTQLALQRAPYLVTPQEPPEGRARALATGLARQGVLVLAGTLADRYRERRQDLVYEWVETFAGLYQVLARRLFPSLQKVDGFYADDQDPPIIVMEMACAPIAQVFAGYVVPYVAARQGEPLVSQAELMGVMTYLLKDLEGDDLARHDYDKLVTAGVAALRALLQSRVRIVSLTEFAQPIFQHMQYLTPAPEDVPTPPPDLPEMPGARRTATGDLFSQLIPLRRTDDERKQRKPPRHD